MENSNQNVTANDRQIGGEHYKAAKQHWDWVNDLGLAYLPAQVAKYVTRWRKKNGLQDLEKARHFLEKLIETEKQKTILVERVTNELMDGNDLHPTERNVIIGLAVYQCNDPTVLEDTMHALNSLIAMEHARQKNPASPKPESV